MLHHVALDTKYQGIDACHANQGGRHALVEGLGLSEWVCVRESGCACVRVGGCEGEWGCVIKGEWVCERVGM